MSEIGFVDLEADEFLHSALLRGNGRISNTQKRIEHRPHARDAVQLDAPLGELNGKGCGVRPFFGAALDRFVRNKPGIAAAASVTAPRVRPASDIALVLIGHAECEPVDVDLTVDGEMKNVFVAVVQKSFGTDRLEVPEGSVFDGD